jgi:hypothetical protein
MSLAPRASTVAPADVEAWLAELGLEPLERADREGVTSWDLVLDGRRRAALRVTLILDPSLALVVWTHFAPPINDAFRKSYRKLLRWNDELPFVKFSVGEDERPLLTAELPVATVDRDGLGLALARHLAVADRYHAEASEWLKGGGWKLDPPSPDRQDGPGLRLVARYRSELMELLEAPERPAGAATADAAEATAADADDATSDHDATSEDAG